MLQTLTDRPILQDSVLTRRKYEKFVRQYSTMYPYDETQVLVPSEETLYMMYGKYIVPSVHYEKIADRFMVNRQTVIPFQVWLPMTIREIGRSAFMASSLNRINLENVTKIGPHAFSCCNDIAVLDYSANLRILPPTKQSTIKQVIVRSPVLEKGSFIFCHMRRLEIATIGPRVISRFLQNCTIGEMLIHNLGVYEYGAFDNSTIDTLVMPEELLESLVTLGNVAKCIRQLTAQRRGLMRNLTSDTNAIAIAKLEQVNTSLARLQQYTTRVTDNDRKFVLSLFLNCEIGTLTTGTRNYN